MIYSSNVPKRLSFLKKNALEYDLSSIIRKDDIYFHNISFFYRRKIKHDLSQKNPWEYDVFYMFDKDGMFFCYKFQITLLSKMQRWSFSKNTPKHDISGITGKDDICPRKDDIEILDGHSKKSLNDCLYFYGDLFKCFIYCFPMKKF